MMETLALLYKISNLYAHAAHNLCGKSLFMQDHEHFADLYEAYEDHYDDIIERMIGLGQPVDIQAITMKACQAFANMQLNVAENAEYFKKIIELEQAIQQIIAQETPKASIGTQQLIGDQADKSEARLYKLKQRVKK